MEKEVRILVEPKELLVWTNEHRPEIVINAEGAEILLNTMQEMGYQAGITTLGQMVRKDAAGTTEEYSLDEMIDDVSEWHFVKLNEADEDRKKASNFIEFVNAQARYMKLQRTEQTLDRLFEQTVHGKKLNEMAYLLAMTLIERVVNDENLDESVENLSSSIREYATDKRGR